MSGKGFQNLIWFMGVVEWDKDPQKLGRVQVRCFGFHSEDKALLPTADLPWAYLISGTFGANIQIPQQNDWVWGFFIDGKYAQQPMLVGKMLGMPTNPGLPGDAFAGETEAYPACEAYQPDFSRLARGENIEQTSVAVKNITSTTDIQTASGTVWSQQNSPYNARYTDNWVHETKAGHVFELDSTKGAERINLYHAAGTFVEMDQNGSMVIKASNGDMSIIIGANGNVHITGDYNITSDGQIGVYSKNDMHIKVDGDLKTNVHGNYELNVAGYMNTNVGEAIRTRGLNLRFESAEEFDVYSGTELRLGAKNISAKSSGELYLQSVEGAIHAKSSTTVNLQSADIHVNASGTVFVDTFVDMANGGAAEAAAGLDTQRTELPSEDVPEKKSPVKKTIVTPEAVGLEGRDDGYEFA